MQNSPHFFTFTLHLLSIILSSNLHAQWVATDRFPSSGGGVFSLGVSGANVFAGTFSGGIFTTTDNGTSWTEVNSGLTNSSVWSFAVSGSNVFAGTFGGGVFITTNNGANWTEANSGLTDTEIYSLAFSGSNLFAGTGGGVFLSTDNGTSWTEVNSGLPNTWARTLAVSGSNLFAGVGVGVFLSTDNGTSWTEVNSGLPTNITIYSLAVSGTNLFVGTNGGGVYLSTDNGTNWTEVNSGLADKTVWALAVSGSNVFAGTDDGVFLTTNNGSSWLDTEYDIASAYAVVVTETNVFAGGGFSRVWRRPLSELITDVNVYEGNRPSMFYLQQNYPNPFNPTTTIGFGIPVPGFVSLKVLDLLGREVATLINEQRPAGGYNLEWDASGLPSGIYLYRLQADKYTMARKLILLK